MRHFQSLVLFALVIAWLAIPPVTIAQGSRSFPPARLVVEPRREVIKALLDAKTAIDQKQYRAAIEHLQHLLDLPEDNFLEPDFEEAHASAGGIRKRAIQLLMSLPADGQAAYELDFGATARDMLTKATANDNWEEIAEVARRYAVTQAGFEATVLLAAAASDANRPLDAAFLIESLRYHPKKSSQVPLLRAVYWSRAGRIGRGVAALKELKRQLQGGKVSIGGQDIAIPDNDDAAARWLQTLSVNGDNAEPLGVRSWMMTGGTADRNSSAAPASLVGRNVWRVSTLKHLSLGETDDEIRRHRETFQEALHRVLQSMQEDNHPILPAAQPLVIGDTVVYRTIGDVTAISLSTGELLWRSSIVDESLARLIYNRLLEARLRISRGALMETHFERRLFRDQAAGSLSSDGKTVFSLEELEGSASTTMNALGILSEVRAVNKLVAYDLAGGEVLWEVGGPRGSQPAELSAQYFLGPPLVVDGKLYLISEIAGALQLVVLNQQEDRRTLALDWSQTLIATDPPLSSHPLRRLSGLSPSISDGILVCPTSSGAVIAIDLVHRSLLWGFQYSSLVRPNLQNGLVFQGRSTQDFQLEEADKSSRWMDSNVLIADGKVLVTPRDSTMLYCLDLIDGHELWHMQREDWMYVACVTDGRVVLVGRHGLGAVQLSDGAALDSFAEADVEPTGRGIRIGSSYFLPTSTGEIATVDLRTGRIIARSKLAEGIIPGNLAAGSGAIVSQGIKEIIGFTRLSIVEQQITDDLKANPNNPEALALRGELRLQAGDQRAGLADLRQSLKSKSDPHVKSVLAAAILADIRNAPARIHDHIEELESITDDPQQKNEFLRLFSQTLESEGNRRGAFAQMIRLAQTSQFLDEMQQVDGGYSVRTGRSIRARLINMYGAASAEERSEFDKVLEKHIQESAVGVDRVVHLQRCLRFFSGLPHAESLLLKSAIDLENNDRKKELFRSFLRSEDLGVAGKATAVWCADLIAEKKWNEAAPLVNRLKLEYSDQICLGDRTGGSLADEWLNREELKSFLAPPSPWKAGPITVQRREAGNQGLPMNLPAEVLSRSGAALSGWSFESDLSGAVLQAYDAAGVYRWKLALPTEAEFLEPEYRNAAIPCQVFVRDSWLIVARWSYFVVVDASSTNAPRIAWYQSLRTSTDSAMQQQRQALGIRRFPFGQPSTSTARLGRVLGITRETVIYSIGTRIRAADLETGRLAWSRQDLNSEQLSGSADDRAVVVQASGITFLRTLDGARLAKRILQPGTPVWANGSRLLVLRSKADRTIFEMRDSLKDSVIWSREFSPDTLATPIEDEDVAFLEPSGKLVVARLLDCHDRYQSELPLKAGPRDKNWFTVQRTFDRDIIMGGEILGHRATNQPIPFVSPTQKGAMAFDGYVCGVRRSDGKLQWSTAVEKAALDRSVPANLPVLLFATRQFDARNGLNQFIQRYRMTTQIIDKRTGLKIYSTEEAAPPNPPFLDEMPVESRIVINFGDWQLDLQVGGSETTK